MLFVAFFNLNRPKIATAVLWGILNTVFTAECVSNDYHEFQATVLQILARPIVRCYETISVYKLLLRT